MQMVKCIASFNTQFGTINTYSIFLLMAYIHRVLFCLMIISTACSSNLPTLKEVVQFNLEGAKDSVALFAKDIISTRYNERDMAISSSGDDLFYSLGNYNQQLRAIVHLHKKKRADMISPLQNTPLK
jgi:hypothetical protein